MIKKIVWLILIGVLHLGAENFSKKATVTPEFFQQGEEKRWCPISGESLEDFYKTSYKSKLQMNGNNRQYSSLRGLIIDTQEYGIDKKTIEAIDVSSQKYFPVENLFFVINSKINNSTLFASNVVAFKKQEEAQEFIKEYQGKIVSFDEAFKMAQNLIKQDEVSLKTQKMKQIYPRGKKIFEKVCQKEEIDPTNYIEINELKADIINSKLCKPLKEEDLQAVALYIWEVKRFGDLDSIESKVQVGEDEKCPVCGMFTYKYPRWAAQIFYEEGEVKKHWSFDGVKDLMKFYFNPLKWGDYQIAKKENITKILVTDYYTQKGIDGIKAFYVIRSDVYGPMGHEFIPFETLEAAKTFQKDHFGKKIVEFKDIVEEEVYRLDYNE